MRFLPFIIILLIGCMSTHKEHMSKAIGDNQDKDLLVSVEINDRYSTENFVVLEYTIENKGSDFKRFDKVQLELDEKLKDKIRVVVSQDLVNWSEGIKNKLDKEHYNFGVFMGGLSALALTTAALSNDPKYTKISSGVAMAGAGTLTLYELRRVREKVRNAGVSDERGLIPKNHILASPVNVPPNLFLKRFAVFHVDKKTKDSFYSMKVNFTQGDKKQSYAANFKNIGPGFLACTEAEKVSEPMIFNKWKIPCARTCERLHPFSRANCKKRFEAHRRRLESKS